MTRAARAPLRVLRSGSQTPAANMALDTALLEAGHDVVLRLYRWRPPGLSIGWFQDVARFRDVPGDHRLVRRPTGGGAIYHDDELTFALVGDAAALGDSESLYAQVHDALVRALGAVGVAARRIEDGPAGPGARALRTAWCFEHPARHDVVAPDGRKLAGSAQRRVRTPRPRVLQHGSVVFRRPAATPFCAAIADQVEPDAIRDALTAAWIGELATALGRTPIDDRPTAAETRRATELEPSFADPEAPTCRISTRC